MVAFALAGIIFVVTVLICMFAAMANAMSDAVGQDGADVLSIFVIGTALALFVAACHFLPAMLR